jgi:hypothetical protein
MAAGKSFADDSLRDFTATPRVLQLAAMAAVAGSLGAGAAWGLLRLIAFFTNLAYWGRFSTAPASIPAHLPPWSIAIPVAVHAGMPKNGTNTPSFGCELTSARTPRVPPERRVLKIGDAEFVLSICLLPSRVRIATIICSINGLSIRRARNVRGSKNNG